MGLGFRLKHPKLTDTNMNRSKMLLAGLLAVASAVCAQAQSTPTIPDMTTNISAANTAITSVLVIVGATAVFFVGLRIYKWVGKK